MPLPHGHARAKAQRKDSRSWVDQLPKAAERERAEMNHARHVFRQRHVLLEQVCLVCFFYKCIF